MTRPYQWSITELFDKIESIAKIMDDNPNRTEPDKLFIPAIQADRDKLIQHYVKCSWIYSMALILQPRHKIVCFNWMKRRKELKASSIKTFEKVYRKCYHDEEKLK